MTQLRKQQRGWHAKVLVDLLRQIPLGNSSFGGPKYFESFPERREVLIWKTRLRDFLHLLVSLDHFCLCLTFANGTWRMLYGSTWLICSRTVLDAVAAMLFATSPRVFTVGHHLEDRLVYVKAAPS